MFQCTNDKLKEDSRKFPVKITPLYHNEFEIRGVSFH